MKGNCPWAVCILFCFCSAYIGGGIAHKISNDKWMNEAVAYGKAEYTLELDKITGTSHTVWRWKSSDK